MRWQRALTKSDYVKEVNAVAETSASSDLIKSHRALYFAVFDSGDAFNKVVKYVRNACSTGRKLNTVRDSICGGVGVKL